jgi:hemerythrin-like domain-containing protein
MANEKKSTEILKEEHESVLQKLDELEEAVSHLDKKGEISAKLKALASFFDTDFWIHFTKEEEALFPEIEKFIPREGGPTGMMLSEHEDIRNTNTKVQQAINEYFRGSDNSKAEKMIQTYGTHFIGVLRDHIHKENDVLFIIADMHLDEAQTNRVIKLFREIEKDKGQEKYHQDKRQRELNQ